MPDARPLREVEATTLLTLLAAIGPPVTGREGGVSDVEATRGWVAAIRTDGGAEAQVHHRLIVELGVVELETVEEAARRLREAVGASDARGIARVVWVASTSRGLAWRRLEERGRDALVTLALRGLRASAELLAAK